MNRKLTFLCSLLLLGCSLSSIAQTYCPPNIDFELGDYSNWTYYRGQNAPGPVWNLTTCAHVDGLQTLMSGAGTDYYGGFPVVGNGLYSIKLGHDTAEYNADAASYNVHVPTGSGTAFSLIYRYAIVLENPSGHSVSNMPRWEIDVTDSATGSTLPCDNFTYVASLSLPGFSSSPVESRINYCYDVLYKPWTAASIDLTGWGGHTIIVNFKVGGCTQTGHFGYAYLDMNCGLFKISTVACKATLATLTAPPGDSLYEWTDSATFTASYGATQTVVVTVPTVSTTYAVILIPYYGYGCTDTLYARLLPSDLETHQSDDTTVCYGTSVILSPNATDVSLPLTYYWTPSTGLSCTTCDSTIATPPVGKNLYQVTTTDAGGCLQTDSINVTVDPIPGVIKGNKSVCLGLTNTLTDSIAGGSWSSGNSTVASIGSSTGVVTGKVVGTASITYTFGLSCSTVYTTVTVNPLPTGILGTAIVCVGLTTTLTDATGGGTWSSTGTAAAVGSGTGVVTGISAGTSTVTYTLSATGCIATKVVTVNPLPDAILGTKTVCAGFTTTLSDFGVGTWSSGNSAVAIVGSAGVGTVTGETPGTATITYTLTTGCISTAVVTVNATPVTISGIKTMCIGLTTALSDGTSGGIWSSSDTTVAKVGSLSGVVTGVAATIVSISYTLAGCSSISTVTVTPLPPSPSGTLTMCVGTNNTLTDLGGGTWSSGNMSVAIIGSTSGVVTGESKGTATITYALGTGCAATVVVTVNPNPTAIIGITPLCPGSCITLSDATSGGTWKSINGAIASVGVSSGTACGVSGGMDTIVYTLPTGCLISASLTVNPPPSAIAGAGSVCIGSTITLTDPGGGTWSSGNTTIAIVGLSTGVVTGESNGTVTITYTLPTGCTATTVITVNKPPVGITGSTTVCVGATTTLVDGTGGGTWSTSNSAIATVILTSGKVTGWAAGTATITYTIFSTGCIATTTVTVSTAPGALAGVMSMCQGQSTTLTDAVTGGLWSSSNTAVATVSGGVVTGVITGSGSVAVATITYSIGGSCYVSAVVSVLPLPAPIAGTPVMCVGGSATLTDGGGGTWASSNTTEAIVSGGVVTGILASYPIITYSLSGCFVTKTATVNPLPSTIIGVTPLCEGSSIVLSDATAGGTWSSSNTAIAGIGSLTGDVTAGSTSGLVTIFYKLITTGCTTVATLTVDPPPSAIGGPVAVCVGSSITATDGGGGTWSSGSTTVSVVSGSGLVTGLSAGPAIITYTLPTGCTTTETITVNPLPGPVSGPTAVCISANITLSDAGGGTWTSATSSIATIGLTTGIVTGGSTLGCTKIFYTLPTGCITTTTVCVSPSPTTILGPSQVCVGSTITLSDAISGGGWTAAPLTIGTIDPSGDFTGITTGVDTVTYSLGSGCTISTTVTVNPIPKVITGSGIICVGQTLTVTDATGGGTWSIVPATVATITGGGGVVTGKSPGTATITYSLGCVVTTTVTVSPTPLSISGPSSVCQGSTITLSDTPLGGIWTSSAGSIASVGSTGIVDGASGGAATITYSLGGACYATQPVTVNPISVIMGATTLCAGVTTTLSDATPGGTWHSSNVGVATIGASTGILTGVATGTSTVCYTTATGCTVCTIVNISLSPTAIVGPANVCKGSSITLSDAVGGGTWTDPTGLAAGTIDPVTGVFTGIASGSALITYSLGGSCRSTTTVSVDPVDPIIGAVALCTGDKTTLTNGVPGGTWTTASTVVTVNLTTGAVTAGISAGTATITYTTPSGCISTFVITVNSVPGPILGTLQVCKGQTTTLSDATVGTPYWSAASANITIGGSTGVVTGVLAGTAIVTYSLGSGCSATAVVTVNPLPSAISGSSNVCVGYTVTLTDGGGGIWSSLSTSIAIGSLSGVVTGFVPPSATVTYTLPTGCATTKLVTVNPLPAPISGPATVCVTQSITLVDGGGGTWTSSNPSIASVAAGTGVVSGVAKGTAIISYKIPTGCYVFTTVTVVPLPTTITGPASVCVGNTAILADGSPGGVWTSVDPSIAIIGSSTGLVTGISSGTVLMSYTVGSGCSIFRTIIVNPESPVTGSTTVCQRQTTVLSDTTLGGTWSSSNTALATVNPVTGEVTGVNPGAVTINYLLSTGCKATYAMTVLAAPKPITGPAYVCVGQTTTLHDLTLAGVWSSDITGIATIDATGIVTGVSAGTTPISYTAGGCPATITMTVYPVPAPVSGSTDVCVGQTTALTDAGGGIWSSLSTPVATVGVSSGIVSGITTGTSTILYTLSTGCSSSIVMTVNPIPGPVTGVNQVCVGMTTALSDTSTGGAWSSDKPGIATVDAVTGIVKGITAGTATIYYSYGTGCYASMLVIVNPTPSPISGPSQVCVGSMVTYTDIGGGTWSSFNSSIAAVGSTSGIVMGVSAGATIITYTLGTGCTTENLITVNPVPLPITGNPNLCVGTTTMLNDATGFGTWSSLNPAVATTDISGDITGVTIGTSTISYTLITGCAAAVTAIVHPFPKAISGTGNVCLGATDLFTDAVSGGLWSSTNTTVATAVAGTGMVTGVSVGATNISYTITVGCAVGMPVNVVPLPTKYTIMGGGNFCSGGTGVDVWLNGSATATEYFLYVGGVVATGPLTGTGALLDFGMQAAGGTYTVVAVNTATGCSNNMSGSVSVVVNPSVTPAVGIYTAGGDTVCSGALTNLTATPVNGGLTPAYQWNINGTNVGLGSTYSYVPADGDIITLTMTSSANCAVPAEVSDKIKMTVSAPQMPSAAIAADPGDTVCQGFPVTLTAVSEYGGAAPVITWMKNTVVAAKGSTFTYLPVNGDIIYVTMTSNYPCVVTPTVNSPVVIMTVDSPVIPHVMINADPGADIGIGWTDTLTAVVTNAGPLGVTYQWLVDGMPVKGQTGPEFITNTLKNGDTVSVSVTSSGMCEMTTHNWIYINESDVAVHSVNGNTGGITVLPNPNKGEFTVQGSLGTNNDEEVTLELTDLLGQVVYTNKTMAKGGTINEKITLGKSIANGMYLLNLRSSVDTKVFHVVVEQ